MPQHFRLTLEHLGAELVAFVPFPDHHPYTRAEIARLVSTAEHQRGAMLVTTEKDGVRLRRMQPLGGPVWALRIGATILEQETAWKGYILGMIKG
jgi:tetraacyldisaccharide 4'-kinase